jgi:hypothetical protein
MHATADTPVVIYLQPLGAARDARRSAFRVGKLAKARQFHE